MNLSNGEYIIIAVVSLILMFLIRPFVPLFQENFFLYGIPASGIVTLIISNLVHFARKSK